MLDSWLEIVSSVLRPARPRLADCELEREAYLTRRRTLAEQRARAIAGCEDRIESARAEVFAANDGVVTARMRQLEREWLVLSRSDPDEGLMDLWARIAPTSWIDRKRWRDGASGSQLDRAIALASDVEGVLAAESAIGSLRGALAAWGTRVGWRVRWQAFEKDSDVTTELLARPLRAAREAISMTDAVSPVFTRASELERTVHEAACERFPARPALARSLASAALVDFVWQAAAFPKLASPVAPLKDLWRRGYFISAIDAAGVILELPAL